MVGLNISLRYIFKPSYSPHCINIDVNSKRLIDMKISTIKVKCRPWGHKFEVPFLWDFSYGQFIYSSRDGQRHRYLEGINNKTWDFVNKIIEDNNKRIKDKAETIQSVLGQIADKDASIDFYQNKKIICPTCGRNAWHLYRDDIVGSVEVKEMTFDRFERLTIEEKEKEIKLLIK
jgi:hypothetical protein